MPGPTLLSGESSDGGKEKKEKVRQQTVLLRKTVEENDTYEILDWEKEMENCRAGIQLSEKETEER